MAKIVKGCPIGGNIVKLDIFPDGTAKVKRSDLDRFTRQDKMDFDEAVDTVLTEEAADMSKRNFTNEEYKQMADKFFMEDTAGRKAMKESDPELWAKFDVDQNKRRGLKANRDMKQDKKIAERVAENRKLGGNAASRARDKIDSKEARKNLKRRKKGLPDIHNAHGTTDSEKVVQKVGLSGKTKPKDFDERWGDSLSELEEIPGGLTAKQEMRLYNEDYYARNKKLPTNLQGAKPERVGDVSIISNGDNRHALNVEGWGDSFWDTAKDAFGSGIASGSSKSGRTFIDADGNVIWKTLDEAHELVKKVYGDDSNAVRAFKNNHTPERMNVGKKPFRFGDKKGTITEILRDIDKSMPKAIRTEFSALSPMSRNILDSDRLIREAIKSETDIRKFLQGSIDLYTKRIVKARANVAKSKGWIKLPGSKGVFIKPGGLLDVPTGVKTRKHHAGRRKTPANEVTIVNGKSYSRKQLTDIL